MSSEKSIASRSSGSSPSPLESKTLPGFLGNLNELQEYRLKEAYLVLYQASGIAPTSLEVGVPRPAEVAEKAAPKPGKFSFRSAPAAPQPEATTIAAALAEFKEACGELEPDQIIRSFRSSCRSDHPDTMVLRFLRARKWELAKAVHQFGITLRWRILDWNIEKLLERGEQYYIDVDPDEGFINQYKEGKVTLHGKDKQGRPLVFIHVAKHDPRAQSDEAMERYTLHVIEAARLCLSRDVTTSAVVFDLGGFGLGNMDYHVVKFILVCFERFYPECLGYLFIHRAPWVFSSVWSIIKGWIDPVVASKISFTKNENDLLKYIDSDQLPKSMGGTSEFEYEWIPPQDGESRYVEEKEEKERRLKERDDLCSEYEQATLKWIATKDKESSAKANEEREKIYEKIYAQFWHLDPYIRARIIADRNGSLSEFKPELKSGGVAQPTL